MIYNIEVKKKLHNYFVVSRGFENYHRNWLRGDCPSCGKSKKFGIQLSQNRSNCFVCGYKKQPMGVLMDMEHFHTWPEVNMFLKTYTQESFERYIEEIEVEDNGEKPLVEFPLGYRLISLGDSELAKLARNYLKSRGFNIRKLSYSGVGYVEDGEELFGYIIFPYFKNNKLVYYQTRNFVGFGPKFRNPDEEELGIGKTQVIYNEDALGMYNRIWLVESITNALTIGNPSIAIGGKNISPYQKNQIVKSPCKELIIGLDPDAIEQAIKLALEFVGQKKVKILQFPEDTDVNKLGWKKTKAIERASPFLSFGQLLQLKDDLL